MMLQVMNYGDFRQVTERLIIHAATRSNWRLVSREIASTGSEYLIFEHEAAGRRLKVRISDHAPASRRQTKGMAKIYLGNPSRGLGNLCARLEAAEHAARAQRIDSHGEPASM